MAKQNVWGHQFKRDFMNADAPPRFCFSKALNHNNLLTSIYGNTFCFLADKNTGHTPSQRVFIVYSLD